MKSEYVFKQKKVDSQFWGYFGYEAAMCDLAIAKDDPEMLKACIDNDWIDSTCTTLGNKTIPTLCKQREKIACAALLEELGWK